MILDFPDLTDEYVKMLSEVVNGDDNPVIYLAIDPGQSNGICGYNEKGFLQFMTTLKAEEVMKFLRIFKKIKVCVVEEYKIYEYKSKQHINSDVPTLRTIGKIEDWCEVNGATIVKQGASIKSTGYKWLGKDPLPKSNPANHKWDAHVHFIYWAVRRGLINAADLLRRNT